MQQTLQQNLEGGESLLILLAPEGRLCLQQRFLKTLSSLTKLLDALATIIFAVAADGMLQSLHEMRHLHPCFLQGFDARQLMLVQPLHVRSQQVLGTQALHAEHQNQRP
ncbi:hypothetical protein D9M72_609350 [compost metagenome]